MNYKTVKSLLVIFLISGLLFACAGRQHEQTVNNQTPTPVETYLQHTITYSGETLAEIAAWYTGRAQNWTAIKDANPDIRPDRLRLGQVVLIPNSMVINDKPFSRRVGKKKATPVEPTPSTVDTSAAVEPTPVPSTVESTVTSSTPAETPKPEQTPVAAVTSQEAMSAASEVVPVATPSASKDTEREKLLDELLK